MIARSQRKALALRSRYKGIINMMICCKYQLTLNRRLLSPTHHPNVTYQRCSSHTVANENVIPSLLFSFLQLIQSRAAARLPERVTSRSQEWGDKNKLSHTTRVNVVKVAHLCFISPPAPINVTRTGVRRSRLFPDNSIFVGAQSTSD